ncbi:hypothetical protein [Kitasatospora sp. McL0602]|uniref:hypothetical protein n=1 Tax=Kitasatospora sp. McL0602 TaxID=3439530 RepID=UPI003F898FA4
MRRIARGVAAVVAAGCLLGTGVAVAPVASAAPASCSGSQLGNGPYVYDRNGAYVGYLALEWLSCVSQVYGDFHFAGGYLANHRDTTGTVYVIQATGHTQQRGFNAYGGDVADSPVLSVYWDAYLGRDYFAQVTISNGACSGFSTTSTWNMGGYMSDPYPSASCG